MTAPSVTVLMAVHNGADYVATAIDSILRQTFTDFEFVIVDDGSTDDTPARVAAFADARIRVFRNDRNLGLTRSLNRGLAEARGSLVARQDADDVSHPGRLAAQVAFLAGHPDVVVLGTQTRYIDRRGRAKRVPPWPKSTSPLAIRWQLLFDGPLIHSSVVFRRDVIWREMGGYDESFVTSQDFELWTRVASRGYAMRNLSDTLVDYRVHRGSVSSRYDVDRIARLRPVFVRAFVNELGPDAMPSGWPDCWFHTSYPGAFPASTGAVAATVRAVEQIYHAFVSVHPAAAGDVEIRRHRTAMLLRVANYAARVHAIDSIYPFARAVRLTPLMSLASAPRYLAHLLLSKEPTATVAPGDVGRV